MCLLSHSQGLLAVWVVKVQVTSDNTQPLATFFFCVLCHTAYSGSQGWWADGDARLMGYRGQMLVLPPPSVWR